MKIIALSTLILLNVLQSNFAINHQQKISLIRNGVVFELRVSGKKMYYPNDTLTVHYKVKNQSSSNIWICGSHSGREPKLSGITVDDNLNLDIKLGADWIPQFDASPRLKLITPESFFVDSFSFKLSQLKDMFNAKPYFDSLKLRSVKYSILLNQGSIPIHN